MRYGLLNDLRHLDKAKLQRTVDRFVALASGPGEALPEVPLPVLSHDRLRGWVIAEKFGLTSGRVIALCPGAEYGPAKQWPATHFAALADILHRQGFQTFLLGSKKDSVIAETIRTQAAMRNPDAAPVNLCGKTTIPEAIDLLTLTSGVVSNDSGLMHVAAAIGRPLVALYGSTVSSINPPLMPRAIVLERTLPCRPCFQRTCPLGHLDCLNLIGAAEVAERLQSEVALAA
jgi:heptosyltransferase-2